MGVKSKNLRVCCEADFETSHNGEQAWVWLWDICRLSDLSHTTGNTIEEFVDYILASEYKEIYFHNLAFDITYLLPELVKRGYTEYHNDEVTELAYKANIGSGNVVYSLEIYTGVHGKRGGYKVKKITVFDSEKILPMSVEVLGEKLGPEYNKLEIDYNIVRELPYTHTDDERLYIQRDTEIVARYLVKMFNRGLVGSTIGLMAKRNFYDTYLFNNNPYSLSTLFPNLGNLDWDLRRAYTGGIVYLNPAFQGKVLGHGYSLDCNSMYPDKARNYPIPYGMPVRFSGAYEMDNRYPWFIQEVDVTAYLKPDGIPCIRVRGGAYAYSCPSVIDNLTLMLTYYDLLLLQENYIVESITFNYGYKFKMLDTQDYPVFNFYVDTWYWDKCNSEGADRVISKLMLNNLIGKFGTNAYRKSKYAYVEDGVTEYRSVEEVKCSLMYVPLPTYVNAVSRYQIIMLARNHPEIVAYIDTDALHIICDHIPEDYLPYIDPREMGYFKVEREFDHACYKDYKKYIEVAGDNVFTRAAGVSKVKQAELTLTDFELGCKIKRLVQKNIKGGAILVEQTINL